MWLNQIRKWLRFALGFSRREANGFLILLPLIVLIIFSKPIFQFFFPRPVKDFSKERMVLDSLIAHWEPEEANAPKNTPLPEKLTTKLFSFNPNEATRQEMVQLGIPAAVASRVVKYREEGGQFRIKHDLAKIYGLDSALYQKLYTYIDLPERHQRPSVSYSEVKKTEKPVVSGFHLNAGDTTDFMRVKGIGPVLANRIVKYRTRLGGFVATGQLYEVYGLDSAVVRKLLDIAYLDDSHPVRKINLNKAGEKDLSVHPYISKTMAKVIVTYRFQHGDYCKAEDIGDIQSLNEETIDKVLPYLSVADEDIGY